jgi:hypothetical protein
MAVCPCYFPSGGAGGKRVFAGSGAWSALQLRDRNAGKLAASHRASILLQLPGEAIRVGYVYPLPVRG